MVVTLELRIPRASGAHQSRVNRSDVHVVASKFGAEPFGKPRESKFTNAVRQEMRDANLPADGTDIYDAAALALPHFRQYRESCMERPPEKDVKRLAVFFWG